MVGHCSNAAHRNGENNRVGSSLKRGTDPVVATPMPSPIVLNPIATKEDEGGQISGDR